MPANQFIIKRNLATWLQIKLNKPVEYKDIKNKDLIQRFEDDRKNKLAKLITFLNKKGFCFGFALARGAMVATGKKAWWDEILDIVETTDISKADFKKKIKLKNSLNETTLEEIFFKVLNYIISAHFFDNESTAEFGEKEFNQLNLLEPEKDGYQLMGKLPELKLPEDSPDVLLTIKDRKKSGGTLTPEDAEKLLNLTDTAGKICVIVNTKHAIQFDIENGKYNLYNPNYEEKIYQPFDTKKAFIQEVIRILGNSFVFDIVTLDKKLPSDLFSYYNDLVKEKPIDLIKKIGLSLSIVLLEDKVDTLISNACNSKDKKAHDHVAESMELSYKYFNTLAFAEKKPDLLQKLVNYSRESKAYPDSIANALSLQSDIYSSPLTFWADNPFFPEMIADGERTPNWPKRFLQALQARDKDGKTALEKIIKNKSRHLDLIFKAAAKHKVTRQYVMKSFKEAKDHPAFATKASATQPGFFARLFQSKKKDEAISHNPHKSISVAL